MLDAQAISTLALSFIYAIRFASGQSSVFLKCLIIYYLIADPNDWVNVNYIVQRRTAADKAVTAGAQTSIIGGASLTAKQGPWSVYSLVAYIYRLNYLFQLSRTPKGSYHRVKTFTTT